MRKHLNDALITFNILQLFDWLRRSHLQTIFNILTNKPIKVIKIFTFIVNITTFYLIYNTSF